VAFTRTSTDPSRSTDRLATNDGQGVRATEQLPRGRHGLSREEVIASQRQRILDAMAELCAEQSYPSVRIAEIVGRAGVSRATFYELFRDKEDCFVAAMEEALKRLFNAVMPAAYRGDPNRAWPERVADAIEALLACIASHRSYSQMAMVEALAGGERSFERYTVASQVMVTLLDQGRMYASPEARIPSTAARAAQGASEAMIIEEMISGRVDRVPELLPDLLYIALTPYVGQAEALEYVASIRRSARAPVAESAPS
jgi:AcrR family transcriptional regulator